MQKPSFTAWLWLFSMAGQAKATMKPLSWPGLAWLTASGQARRALEGENTGENIAAAVKAAVALCPGAMVLILCQPFIQIMLLLRGGVTGG